MSAPEEPQTIEAPAFESKESDSKGKNFPLAFVLLAIFGFLFVAVFAIWTLDIGGVRTVLMGSFGLTASDKGPVVTTREVEPISTSAEGEYENPFSEEGAGSAETPGYANPFGEEEYANPFEGMEEEYVNPFENL